jgi:hypothetical protein
MRQMPWFSTIPRALGTHLGDMTIEDLKLYQTSIQ